MLAQLNCLQIACQNLGIQTEKLDQNGNFWSLNWQNQILETSSTIHKNPINSNYQVKIFKNIQNLKKPKSQNKIFKKSNFYFVNSQTPFNNQDVVAICKDKFFTYKLLEKTVKQPLTWSFLDPNCSNNYKEYLEFINFTEIAKFISQKLTFPLILKPNSGSLGVNVQKIHNQTELKNGIAKIFDVNSKDYDYVMIAQEFVEIEKEFRVLVVNNSVELVYQKDNSRAEFVGNLNPLHWANATVKIVKKSQNQQIFWQNLTKIVSQISTKLDLNWAGLDIAKMKNGKLILIEINTNPRFSLFLQSEIQTETEVSNPKIKNNLKNLNLQNPNLVENNSNYDFQKLPKHKIITKLYTLALQNLQRKSKFTDF